MACPRLSWLLYLLLINIIFAPLRSQPFPSPLSTFPYTIPYAMFEHLFAIPTASMLSFPRGWKEPIAESQTSSQKIASKLYVRYCCTDANYGVLLPPYFPSLCNTLLHK